MSDAELLHERNAEKRRAVEKALAVGIVALKLDARKPGVVVPRVYAEHQDLVVNFSRRFDPPDLEVDEHRISQTLQFGALHEHCQVPWEAIYTIRAATGERLLYLEDMPQEYQLALARQALQLAPLIDEAVAVFQAIALGSVPAPASCTGWCRRAAVALTGREPPLIQPASSPRLSLVKKGP